MKIKISYYIITLTILTILSFCSICYAGSASGGGISDDSGYSEQPSLAINESGNPVVVWHDNISGEIYIKQWNGATWEVIGSSSASGGGISNNSGNSVNASMVINSSGNPVVAWQDETSGDYEIYIKQWNGSTWEVIGSSSASGGGISDNSGDSYSPSLAINESGNPVVAWYDYTTGEHEIYIKQWNGATWEVIGSSSASGGGISDNSGASSGSSLVINKSGNPVVAWHDNTAGDYEIYIKQWNGANWEEVGTGSASGGGISDNSGGTLNPSLAINKSGNPVVAWYDTTSGNFEIYIKQWNGANWEEVGTGSASGGGISDNSGASNYPSLAINESGNPVVAWEDYTTGDCEIYIKQWNGASWEEVGTGSASGGGISDNSGTSFDSSLAINESGNPVVAWRDNTSGDYEIYIKQWNGANWVEFPDTLSCPVYDLTAIATNNSKIQLDWINSTSQNVLRYNIRYSSETVDINYSVIMDSVTYPTETWISPTLIDGVTYKFVVRTENNLGCEEKNTNIVSATAVNQLSDIPKAVIWIPQNGKKISGNRVTVMARIVDEADIPEIKEIKFQYKVAVSTVWSNISPSVHGNTVNPDIEFPYFIHWDVSGLSEMDYNIRVIAYNQAGEQDPNPGFITITVDHANPDILENLSAGISVRTEAIDNNKVNTVRMGGETLGSVTEVIIPQGALDSNTAQLSITDNPADTPLIPGHMELATEIKDISLGGSVELIGIATIKFPYDDNSIANENRLIPYCYTDIVAEWEKVDDYTLDTVNNIMSINVSHFSLYTLMVDDLGSTFNNLTNYPNPFGDGGTYFVYDLAQSASISLKIYTVSGRLVKVLVDNVSRNVDYYEDYWDGTDANDEPVANGVYVYRITAIPGGGGTTLQRIGKVAKIK